MKYLRQIVIILIVSFLGELCNYIIPLPIPASIYGLVLMIIALKTKIIPLANVREAGKFLIDIMPIMFIPAAVGLVDYWDVLKDIFLPIILITFISTIIVIAVTGRVTQFVIHTEKRRQK